MNSYKARNRPHSSSYSKNLKQGYYKILNPKKYTGNPNEIIYRSKMEYKFCVLCDTDKRIIRWVSEPDKSPFPIKYYNTVKNKISNYYPDFLIEVSQKDGSTKKMVIEVKPLELTPQKIKKPSKYASRKILKNYYNRLKDIAINTAKYKASKIFCKKFGLEYMFVTEKFINNLR